MAGSRKVEEVETPLVYDSGTRSQSVGFLLDFRGFHEIPGNWKVH